jgi:hypothetical protein
MNDISTSTPAAPDRRTLRINFLPCNPQQDALFAVNDDLPADDALQYASNFMDSAAAVMLDTAQEIDSASAWGALYLIQMAKAVVDAATCAITKERREAKSAVAA